MIFIVATCLPMDNIWISNSDTYYINRRKTTIKTDAAAAVVLIQAKHNLILQGLLMQNPDLTLSDLVGQALEPFCRQHEEAAGMDVIAIEITSPALALV